MSIDVLQEKIRKTKNGSVLVLEVSRDLVPPAILEEADDLAHGYGKLCSLLLPALKGTVPAVRFGFGSFAVLGDSGIAVLRRLMDEAKLLGYYVLLDAPQAFSVQSAEHIAATLEDWYFDGLVFSNYLGSDILKAYLPLCAKGKSLFPVVRTANRSAPELQDLLSGTRLVHTAAADIINRRGEAKVGRCGYSQVGILAAASAADSLRSLRSKYPKLFLLLDGFDYPNANAKNCSYAFDKLGHGAAACAGASIVGAWKESELDPAAAAVEAAERMKKNLNRYITVL
jgi:orotidine-5'-phosphate decarboxylase